MLVLIFNVKGYNMLIFYEIDKLERFYIKISYDSIFKDGMFNRYLLLKKNNGLFLFYYFENILICS